MYICIYTYLYIFIYVPLHSNTSLLGSSEYLLRGATNVSTATSYFIVLSYTKAWRKFLKVAVPNCVKRIF